MILRIQQKIALPNKRVRAVEGPGDDLGTDFELTGFIPP
jgi:hypothetical protein